MAEHGEDVRVAHGLQQHVAVLRAPDLLLVLGLLAAAGTCWCFRCRSAWDWLEAVAFVAVAFAFSQTAPVPCPSACLEGPFIAGCS
jgi:hypothetical protein